jgi:methionyl aminopeptidase
MISLKTEAEIAAMRESGRMLATILELLRDNCASGMTPKDMSALAKKELRALGGEPAFLGYPGHWSPFPDVICISVNNQVQHSIPSEHPFAAGDVVNFDFGVRYKGMITDAGISLAVDNKTTPDTARLLKGTEKALAQGIQAV